MYMEHKKRELAAMLAERDFLKQEGGSKDSVPSVTVEDTIRPWEPQPFPSRDPIWKYPNTCQSKPNTDEMQVM